MQVQIVSAVLSHMRAFGSDDGRPLDRILS